MMLRGYSAGLLLFCLLLLSTRFMADTPQGQAALTGVTYYVDDDAHGDPGPNDPNMSDPLENGSLAHPFDTIQEAVDLALTDDTVQILPGVFPEDLITISPAGCNIVGSGPTLTIIQSKYGIEASRLEWPSPPAFSVRDLTLEGGSINVIPECLVFNPGDATRIFFDHLILTNSDLTVLAIGGGCAPIDVRVNATILESSLLNLIASGASLNTTITSLQASSSVMYLASSVGGVPRVSIADSTIGGIDASSSEGLLGITTDNVHFTGIGIRSAGAQQDIVVSRSFFDHGGMNVSAGANPDAGSTTRVIVSGNEFHDLGLTYFAGFGPSPYAYLAHRSHSLVVDSNRFFHTGILVSVYVGLVMNSSEPPSITFDIHNNIFKEPAVGARIQYFVPEPDPDSEPVVLHGSFANNSLVGAVTGLLVETNPHIPGQHSVSSVIQNNIIFGGGKGIQIQGTDDQQFTISGNDVYGNTQSDYSGDVPDQTGLAGNISADPLLSDPSALDFHLLPGSPCIDTGQTGPDIPAVDYYGTTRPQDGDRDGVAIPDIGASEFVLIDDDGDGFPMGVDCDDSDSSVHPGAADLPGNALDEDCNGQAACDPPTFWKNHGQFVSCVARVCGTLVTTGSATQTQCDALVSQAAHSSVGRRQRQRRPPVPYAP